MTKGFKAQQRVRLRREVTIPQPTGPAVLLPVATRAIVMSVEENGKIRCKVDDRELDGKLQGQRFLIGPSRLRETPRGRPWGSVGSTPLAIDAD